MAKENRTEVKQPVGDVPTGKTEKGNRNPDTESTGKRTGTGTATGTATGTTEEKVNPGVIPGMATVNDNEPPKPAEPKKAKRKRTNTKQKNNPAFNAEQITSILMTFSTITSQTEGGKFFALTQTEAEQIANPLANIIAKNDSLAGLGEHSDSIALVSACFMIFVPRLIAYITYKKSKKALKDKNIMIAKGVKDNGTKKANSGNDRKVAEPTTPTHSDVGSDILSGLPSIVG